MLLQEEVEAPGVLEVSSAGGSTVEEAAASPAAAAQFEPDPTPEQVCARPALTPCRAHCVRVARVNMYGHFARQS